MENNFSSVLNRRPNAVALVKGSKKYPNIQGRVSFYQVKSGVVIKAEINGLPENNRVCKNHIFGFHIHSGSRCSGTAAQPFMNANGHYNPDSSAHPCHAGDLPPLFSANGRAFAIFLDNRFKASEIIGRTVIIHANPDDFTTQPSGNAGEMIACGEIR